MARTAAALGLVVLAAGMAAQTTGQERPSAPSARRLATNPLVTVASSPSLGDNVNGPTVIRVPAWIARPLGRYYMYFAHHKGQFIRLAYADAIGGPWTVYEPGVLQVRDTAFSRPQPDPADSPEGFYTHVASPEIRIDAAARTLTLWVHGWWTNGEMWPTGAGAARPWANQRGYGQYTQGATSADGLTFQVRPDITRTSYLRVFDADAGVYGMARLGRLFRAPSPATTFDGGPNPFRDGPYADRVRHVSVRRHADTLDVFFTAIGDAPERVMFTTINLSGPWEDWRTAPAIEVLRPETSYECPALPVAPSEAGDIEGPAHQMRDPFLFEDEGRAWLFYTVCGEQGIAAAELLPAN
jgi:hypothetical protein